MTSYFLSLSLLIFEPGIIIPSFLGLLEGWPGAPVKFLAASRHSEKGSLYDEHCVHLIMGQEAGAHTGQSLLLRQAWVLMTCITVGHHLNLLGSVTMPPC